MGSEPFRSFLFGAAADFAHHDDALGLRVVGEPLEAVDEVGAVEGVAANAHHRGLPQAQVRRLLHRFVPGVGRRIHDDSENKKMKHRGKEAN